jgi:ABC-2 type transport system permease protein
MDSRARVPPFGYLAGVRSLRAAPTLLRIGFAEAVAYRAEFLVWLLSTNMPLVMLALWSAAAADGPVGRYGQAQFTAYFLVALVVRLSTGAWVIWELNYEIRQGTLSTKLLRPIHPLLFYACQNASAVPLRVVLSLPVAVVLLLSPGGALLSRDPLFWAIFPMALAGAFAITFLAMALVGSLAFYVESAGSVFEIWMGLFGVFSGYLVPLDLFPPWLGALARWLPFRYMLAFPVEMVTGLLGRGQALEQLGVQWLFVALLFAASALAWRRGLRHFSAVGG